MLRVVSTYSKTDFYLEPSATYKNNGRMLPPSFMIPRKAKLLAWGIFLMFFIEAGTLGLIPRDMYMVYRNVRMSDIILYFLIIYSLFCLKEYMDLYESKVLLVVKILFVYLIFEFIVSVINYNLNVIEYFFRLKVLWMSFLVFPFLLLFKRGGIGYLIKLMLPVAIVSNIFYILSAITGIPFLPDIGIVQQSLPGGLKVWRVYGGTFYGEMFMLGLVFYWNEYKFKLIHLPFFILFALPHILAFGRSAWVYFTFSIVLIIVWGSIRKRDFRTLTRQIVMIVVTLAVFGYFFNQFIPQSEELSEAIGARIQQGQEDVKFSEGTYGTRMLNLRVLIDVWRENPTIGIGMHPLWVIKPVTTQEDLISWGLSDVRWAGYLAVYGSIGFLLAMIFQILFIVLSFRLLRKTKDININYFFVMLFFTTLIHSSFLNYTYLLTSISINGFGTSISFFVASIVYLYETQAGKMRVN